MSGASDPRRTALYQDAVIAAARALEDTGWLGPTLARIAAGKVAGPLLDVFTAHAEAGSRVMYDQDGNPRCSWCRRVPGGEGFACKCRRGLAGASGGKGAGA